VRVHGFAFQPSGECADDLLKRTIIVFEPHHRRRLHTWRSRIHDGLFVERRGDRLLLLRRRNRRSWHGSRRILRAGKAGSELAQGREQAQSR
jgi:hypothetical protein